MVNALVSVFRLRSIKFILFAADNFWLYEYHHPNYTWFTSNVFSTIRLIESKKQQIINPEELPFIKKKVLPSFPSYLPYSANDKYAQIEGKDSFFFRSTV